MIDPRRKALLKRSALPLLLSIVTLTGAYCRFRQAASSPETTAGLTYYYMGLNLKKNAILAFRSSPTAPTAERGALFPSFIALTMTLAGESPLRVRLTQAAMGSAMIPAVYIMGAAMATPLAGLVGAALYAWHPEQIGHVSNLGMEFFYSVLLAGIAAWLIRWSGRPTTGTSACLGLAVGTSLTCRSPLFLFPLLLCVYLWVRRRRTQGVRSLMLWILLCCYVPLIPWAARNAVHFREFVPFEHRTAASAVFAGSMGMIESWEPLPAVSLAALGDRNLLKLSHGEQKKQFASKAVERALSHPLRYAATWIQRLIYIASMHPWLFLLAAIGAYWDRRNAAFLSVAMLIAYFWAVHALIAVEKRHLEPLTLPLVLLASAGVAAIADASKAALRGAADRALSRGSAAEASTRRRGAAGVVGPRDGSHLPSLGRVCAVFLSFVLCVYASATCLLGMELAEWGRPGASRAKADQRRAIAFLDEAIRRSPLDASLLNDRGVLHYRQGREEAAVRDFRHALVLDPGFVEPLLSLAAVSSGSGDHESARRYCDRAIAKSTPGRRLRRMAEEDRGRDALALYSAAFECRASALSALGRPLEARRDIEKSRAILLETAAVLKTNPAFR